MILGLTRVSSQCQLLCESAAGANIQVDAQQDGDEKGGRGELQEVTVDVGEVNTLIHCQRYCCSTDHDSKETCLDTAVRETEVRDKKNSGAL